MHEYIASSNASMFLLRVGFLSSRAGPDARDTTTTHNRPDCAGTWVLHFRCRLPVPHPVSNGSTASTFFSPCMFLWFVKFRGNEMHILSRSFYVFPLFSVNFFCVSRSVVPAWQVENSKCCCKFPRGDWSLIYLWTDAVPLFPVLTWLNKVLPNFFRPLLFILNSLLQISCSWYTDTENT